MTGGHPARPFVHPGPHPQCGPQGTPSFRHLQYLALHLDPLQRQPWRLWRRGAGLGGGGAATGENAEAGRSAFAAAGGGGALLHPPVQRHPTVQKLPRATHGQYLERQPLRQAHPFASAAGGGGTWRRVTLGSASNRLRVSEPEPSSVGSPKSCCAMTAVHVRAGSAPPGDEGTGATGSRRGRFASRPRASASLPDPISVKTQSVRAVSDEVSSLLTRRLKRRWPCLPRVQRFAAVGAPAAAYTSPRARRPREA